MASHEVWAKRKEVFQKYESGAIIDINTKTVFNDSTNAEEHMNLVNVTATVFRGLNGLSMGMLSRRMILLQGISLKFTSEKAKE